MCWWSSIGRIRGLLGYLLPRRFLAHNSSHFTLAIVNDWHIHSIDFVLAFIKTDIYMRPSLQVNDPRYHCHHHCANSSTTSQSLSQRYQHFLQVCTSKSIRLSVANHRLPKNTASNKVKSHPQLNLNESTLKKYIK